MIRFFKRNLKLSVRKPEVTSLGRATFNPENVKVFYDKLGDIYEFNASQIWNIDETGVFTLFVYLY